MNHSGTPPRTLGNPSVARVCVHSASGSRKSDCSPCIIIKYQLGYPLLTSVFIGSALIHNDAAACIDFSRANAARNARVHLFRIAQARAKRGSGARTRKPCFAERNAEQCFSLAQGSFSELPPVHQPTARKSRAARAAERSERYEGDRPGSTEISDPRLGKIKFGA